MLRFAAAFPFIAERRQPPLSTFSVGCSSSHKDLPLREPFCPAEETDCKAFFDILENSHKQSPIVINKVFFKALKAGLNKPRHRKGDEQMFAKIFELDKNGGYQFPSSSAVFSEALNIY